MENIVIRYTSEDDEGLSTKMFKELGLEIDLTDIKEKVNLIPNVVLFLQGLDLNKEEEKNIISFTEFIDKLEKDSGLEKYLLESYTMGEQFSLCELEDGAYKDALYTTYTKEMEGG